MNDTTTAITSPTQNGNSNNIAPPTVTITSTEIGQCYRELLRSSRTCIIQLRSLDDADILELIRREWKLIDNNIPAVIAQKITSLAKGT